MENNQKNKAKNQVSKLVEKELCLNEKNTHINEIQAKIMEILLYALKKDSMLRIGQIITAAAAMGGWCSNDIFYCTDEVLLKGLKLLYKENIRD